MKGFVTPGETDYEKGYARGKKDGNAASFLLTIKVDGVNRFVTHPQHEARAEGWVECAEFGGRRTVGQGTFNLFVDSGDPQHKTMYYRLWFADDQNRPLTLLGFKDVKDDPGMDEWSDTTTLYVRVLEGHRTPDEDGRSEERRVGKECRSR